MDRFNFNHYLARTSNRIRNFIDLQGFTDFV